MHTTPVQSHSSFQELPILGSSPSTHKEYRDKDSISSKVCSREFGEYTTVCTQCKRVFVPFSMVKGIPIRTSKEDGEWIKCDEISSSNKPINTSHGLCRECFANMDADLLLSNPSPRRNLLSKSLASPEALRHLPSRPKRVLIVDDNQLQRQIHQRLVEQAGFDCDVACSGAQALELVQKHTYCLVLVDLVMAPMDGWTTTRKIRNYLLQAIGFASALPRIVAVTGLTIDKDLLKRCTESGIDDALHKPINAAVLKKVLPVGNMRTDR